MLLSSAVKSVFNDKDNLEVLETIIFGDWQNIQKECEKHGEEMDYLVEKSLEGLTEGSRFLKSIADRVSEYWLELKDVNGSEPFEIKVRCAEFLAAFNKDKDVSNEELENLADSENWTDRLVAGWMIRDRDDDFALRIKSILCNDLFQDDNRNFLVRESIKEYDD